MGKASDSNGETNGEKPSFVERTTMMVESDFGTLSRKNGDVWACQWDMPSDMLSWGHSNKCHQEATDLDAHPIATL